MNPNLGNFISNQGLSFNSYEEMEAWRQQVAERKALEARMITPAIALSVVFKPQKSIVIRGRCQYDLKEKEHFLIIERIWDFESCSTNSLGEFVLNNIPENPYSTGYFINTKRLASKLKSLPSLIQYENMLENDKKEVKELYQELTIGNRFLCLEDVKLNFENNLVQEGINMLLYAFSPRLSGELFANFVPYGTKMSPFDWMYLADRNSQGATGSFSKW